MLDATSVSKSDPSAPLTGMVAPMPHSKLRSWYITFVLTACYTLAFLDSRLPLILVESIKADLKLSDTQIGLIAGPAFSVTYALAAMPIARLSDRGSRKYVIAVAVSIWSLFTAAAGMAHSFGTLLVARTGVAIGESALTPAAHSIIAGMFPATGRARAIAVYSSGIAIGSFLALTLGGYMNDRYGWRSAMYLVGATGLTLTLIVALTVREPPRTVQHASSEKPARKQTVKSLFRDPVIRHTIIGGTLLCVANGAAAWIPAVMLRSFSLTTSQVGATFGAAAGLAALVGVLAGGFVNDWLAKGDPRRAFWFLGIAFAAGGLCKIIGLAMPHYAGLVVFASIGTLLLMFYPGPTYGMIQARVGAESRSFASAVALFCLNGVGISLGGFLTGWLSDHLPAHDSAQSLRWALGIVSLASAWGGAHYFWATRYLPATRTDTR